jgi:hypothetical protein
MRISGRNSAFLVLSVALVGAGAFWATSSGAMAVNRLPDKDIINTCNVDFTSEKGGHIPPIGDFVTHSVGDPSPFTVRTGEAFISPQGLKTVPLEILTNGGHAYGDGIGETHFWYDSSRPLRSAIWEKSPGTEFPAIQEMRFHFFYTVEAFPGKVFRSVNPAIMRSNDVQAFPPPPGTVYNLVQPVALEDANAPGEIIGYITSNRVFVPSEG